MRRQTYHPDDDEINGDDVVQEARHDQDEDAGDKRDERSYADDGEVHIMSLRVAPAGAAPLAPQPQVSCLDNVINAMCISLCFASRIMHVRLKATRMSGGKLCLPLICQCREALLS